MGAGGRDGGDIVRVDPAIDFEANFPAGALGIGIDTRARRAQFVQRSGINAWPPKPGLTDMIKIKSSRSITWSSACSGVAGLKARPALHPCAWINASVRSICSEASG